MKKYYLCFFFLTVCVSVSAQFLKVTKTEYKKGFLTFSDCLSVYLSNGEMLRIIDRRNYSVYGGSHLRSDIKTNIVCTKKYPIGTIVYKSGYSYNVVSLQKAGVYTIKKAVVRTVAAEFEADLKGDFSYRAFVAGIIYNPRASGSVSGKLKGGESTIVNVIFTNQKSTTIKAAEDPIWLEAQSGQKVEHYKLGPADIYKLLF